jgi:hypothetical protein
MRRVIAIAAGTAVLAAALVALVAVLASRDASHVASSEGPGRLETDRGARHLPASERASVPAGELPASGAHRADLVTRDRRRLTDDQILHALELGDVVILYETPQPPAALVTLQEELAGPFDAELAAAGQAVVLARRAGAGPATALAWRRTLRADGPQDPRLRAFADAWLGRGA